jgi:hypothetical protein
MSIIRMSSCCGASGKRPVQSLPAFRSCAASLSRPMIGSRYKALSVFSGRRFFSSCPARSVLSSSFDSQTSTSMQGMPFDSASFLTVHLVRFFVRASRDYASAGKGVTSLGGTPASRRYGSLPVQDRAMHLVAVMASCLVTMYRVPARTPRARQGGR